MAAYTSYRELAIDKTRQKHDWPPSSLGCKCPGFSSYNQSRQIFSLPRSTVWETHGHLLGVQWWVPLRKLQKKQNIVIWSGSWKYLTEGNDKSGFSVQPKEHCHNIICRRHIVQVTKAHQRYAVRHVLLSLDFPDSSVIKYYKADGFPRRCLQVESNNSELWHKTITT